MVRKMVKTKICVSVIHATLVSIVTNFVQDVRMLRVLTASVSADLKDGEAIVVKYQVVLERTTWIVPVTGLVSVQYVFASVTVVG